MTPSCREIDAIFKKAEQKVSARLIKKRSRRSNIYWGRVKDDGSFPLHSGTRIKGVRLGRMHVDNQHGWYGTSEGTYCTTKMCEQKVPEVLKHGFEEYTYGIAQRQIRTDWICINELAVREMPREEIMHMENGMQDASRYVHEEFYRSRFIDHCDNKIMPVVPASFVGEGGTCDESPKSCYTSGSIKNDAFIFERRLNEAGTEDEIDERYIRVNIDPSELGRIGELSFDVLDVAQERLAYEDEAFFGIMDGVDLLDVVCATPRMVTRLFEIENMDMDKAMSYGGYDVQKLKRVLGSKAVARNKYSLRDDPHSMRFYPDDNYNSAILPGFGAYNENNPETWPRLKRVFAYKPVLAGTAGVKFIFNENYRLAPFGITTILTPRVIESQAYPEIDGVGSARKAGKKLGYAGTAIWKNPDWPCNEDHEMGYWKMRFGYAIRPWMTEEGYCFLHRIDHKVRLVPNCCDIASAPCDESVLAYCYDGMGGSETELSGENRPVVYHSNWY